MHLHQACTLNVHSIMNIFGQKVEITQMSISYWMDKKMWYIQTMQYYSSMRKNEVLIHVTVWMNLKYIKEARCKRPNTAWFHLCEMSRIGKTIETESRMVIARSWGKGIKKRGCWWISSFFLEWWNVLELDCSDGCTTFFFFNSIFFFSFTYIFF